MFSCRYTLVAKKFKPQLEPCPKRHHYIIKQTRLRGRAEEHVRRPGDCRTNVWVYRLECKENDLGLYCVYGSLQFWQSLSAEFTLSHGLGQSTRT